MSEAQEVSEERIAMPPHIVTWIRSNLVASLVDTILGKNGDASYKGVVSQRDIIVEGIGVSEYVRMLKLILWQSKTKVSFSDFKEFSGVRNNFLCHFGKAGNWYYDLYMSREYCKDFAEKNPELNKQILQIYEGKLMGSYNESPEEIKLLYRAYEIMLEDPRVSINHDLFA